ncbi:16S rRNA (cytosine(1407)-C(5))-methyltransferase RsmF [Pseudoalteromonas rubra]|uniref:Ribosomal RNA small subunit methyltransferase F n=1 Tax=Pseudoalteromonas rubra TaxID=43658 RepID=A0A5S3WKG0_9GAMM|nr:16S rRNA (cytosine(1407)-C(5))-methyltransferase RsmF [Pseudoalteromonas rubra]TMP27934.1 16S rRNA (cytosine(1407)-C(5))-methyltransferase RsmF [Pseudoalteromonas rubra]TMP31194.1 16S rRNA (cytosine(1407)-C(5))-methyltransferase RsmF [Pseudoalteromonas rubra]
MDTKTYIPAEFIEDVASYIPAHLTMDDFIASCRKGLRRAVRVNTLKMSQQEFEHQAAQLNWQIEPIPWCQQGYWLSRPNDEESNLPIGNTALHLSGCIYVQEASSMLPPMALATSLAPGDTVLDMAAAPGSKTSQLAALMDNQGILIANELSSSRLKTLAATLKRMGVANCALSHFDGQVFGDYMYESFDHILLDAPCSGEGTVRKDPDALKNWSLASNQDIAEVQKTLIHSAFLALKPGGTLVYSTCTLTPLENQQICDHLLDTFAGDVEIMSLHDLFPEADKAATEQGYLHVWPQIYDSEGFFIAKFKKTASVVHSQQKRKKGQFPFSPCAKKDLQAFSTSIKQQFGIEALPGQLMSRDKELWLFPQHMETLQEKIKYSRIGIKVATTHKNGVKLEHEFATCLGQLATSNTFALNASQAKAYFQGQDIRLDSAGPAQGEVVLTLCGAPVGLGKWQKAKIKNKLPRDLVLNGQLITWV